MASLDEFDIDALFAQTRQSISRMEIAIAVYWYDENKIVKRLKEIRAELLLLQRETQDGFKE